MKASKLTLPAICTVLTLCLWLQTGKADKPCAARPISKRSVVCVCNETYCDEIDPHLPKPGQLVATTTSKEGKRFDVVIQNLDNATVPEGCCSNTLTVDPNTTHQIIEGFGGAVTDAAGINWKNLSQTLQNMIIDTYFSEKGLQYNIIRVPIGGSDFSTHAYAYNELPINDQLLTNYSLTREDFEYKLPMIKQAMEASRRKIKVLGTTWSPPLWMKGPTDAKWGGFNYLLEEYYQTYADYILKFLQLYSKNGVDLWGVTTTNEPVNGLLSLAKFNSLGWTPSNMGKWIVNNLGPTIRNSTFKHLKILGHDDQRYTIPLWFDRIVDKYPAVMDYLDGIGLHWYADLAPTSVLRDFPKKYPGKFILATEACEGSLPWQTEKVSLGNWDRAVHYITSILTDLNNDVVGWTDWNLCLNSQGGPNWASNFVDSPIIVYPENQEFIKQPIFYGMGHFSKWIPAGSKRISVSEKKGWFDSSVDNVAFLKEDGNIVLVLYNSGAKRTVAVKHEDKQFSVNLDAKSITTVEYRLQ